MKGKRGKKEEEEIDSGEASKEAARSDKSLQQLPKHGRKKQQKKKKEGQNPSSMYPCTYGVRRPKLHRALLRPVVGSLQWGAVP